MLKQSLKALQERASSTISNKLTGNTAIVDDIDNQNENDLSKNYSVSSSSHKDQDNENRGSSNLQNDLNQKLQPEANHIMQGHDIFDEHN